ncbi:MAG TPA: NUDIX domain-containing protein [Patescibacteria group bacterium]|nr:NUDIX domain-containing protein [Patescibacteria group bacterium]
MAKTNLIQIVDENDNPLRAATMPETHAKGLIHRVVRIMVEDSQGRILLQKRAPNMSWPNCWDNSAAGHVDAGEDYLTAARRELFEEIGIKTDKLDEIGKYYTQGKYQSQIHKRFNNLYKVVLTAIPQQMALQKEEVASVKWFSLKDIKKLIKDKPDKVTDGLRDVIERFYT